MIFIVTEIHKNIYILSKLLVYWLVAILKLIQLHTVNCIAECSMFNITILLSYIPGGYKSA